MSEIRFTSVGHPAGGHIEVDGRDLSNLTRAVDIHAAVDAVPSVVVHLLAWEVESQVDGDVRLVHDGCSHCEGHRLDAPPVERWSERFPGAVNITTIDDARAGHRRFRLEWDEPLEG